MYYTNGKIFFELLGLTLKKSEDMTFKETISEFLNLRRKSSAPSFDEILLNLKQLYNELVRFVILQDRIGCKITRNGNLFSGLHKEIVGTISKIINCTRPAPGTGFEILRCFSLRKTSVFETESDHLRCCY